METGMSLTSQPSQTSASHSGWRAAIQILNGVSDALELGAAGVQVGTAFAYCEESGFDADVKKRVLELSQEGKAAVFTDPLASPSGFPFKVVELEGTLSEPAVYENRDRQRCDLGFLRTAYRSDDGSLAWRCPSEPVVDFVRKGGSVGDTDGRKCLCNSLMANVGLGPDSTRWCSRADVDHLRRRGWLTLHNSLHQELIHTAQRT